MTELGCASTWVLFHGGCMDGITAACVVRLAKGDDRIAFKGVVYGGDQPGAGVQGFDPTGIDLILVDFSFKREKMVELAGICRSILVLDHHKTAQEELSGLESYPNVKCVFDMERSGASLTWDYFFPGRPRPDMVSYVEDRDLWRKVLPDTEAINTAMFSYGTKLNTMFEMLMNSITRPEWRQDFVAEGQAILRMNSEYVRRMTKYVERVEISGVSAFAVNAPILQSDIGDTLVHLSDNTSGMAAMWAWDPKNMEYGVSLRSRKDGPDVSAIAKSFGGGGHCNAAGFGCKELPWRKKDVGQ